MEFPVEFTGQCRAQNRYVDLGSVKVTGEAGQECPVQLMLEPREGDVVRGKVCFFAALHGADYTLTYQLRDCQKAVPSGRYQNHFLLPDPQGRLGQMPDPTVQAEPCAPRDGQIYINDGGRQRLIYHSQDRKRPYFFPFYGADGHNLLGQGLPCDPERSHSHHAGLWIGHKDVNGINFWEDYGDGEIRHLTFEEVRSGPVFAKIRETLQWQKEERVLLKEERTIKVYQAMGEDVYLDIEITLTAREEITFGQTPFGFLGLRVNTAMAPAEGRGCLTNSTGAIGEEKVLGQTADWCAFISDQNAVAVYSAPENGTVCWQARDNGFFAPSVNGQAPSVLASGERASYRYRIYGTSGGTSAVVRIKK